jgi:hypothetical protein
MARPPTPADYKALRRLHAAAGSRDELCRWVDAARQEGNRQRGRKAYADRLSIESYKRLFESQGMTRTELIRQLVRSDPRLRGKNIEEQSAVDRINRKLREFERQLAPQMAALRATFSEFGIEAPLIAAFRAALPDLFRDTN